MPHLNLRKLQLHDYRCFDKFEIDFHPQLTVLVAENGAGKTSILDAIAVAIGPYIGAFDEALGKHFQAKDIRSSRVRETNTNEMETAPQGVRLIAHGIIPNAPGPESENQLSPQPYNDTIWTRELTGTSHAKTTTKGAKPLSDYGKRLQAAVRTPGAQVLLPLVAYYGTGRLWQQKKLTGAKQPRASRTVGYTDCLDPASSYKAFVEWFRRLSFSAKTARVVALETGQPSTGFEFEGHIESVSAAVNCCLAPLGWKSLDYSVSREALTAQHDDFGELPVEQLSDGIRNMIGMVADIAFRATKLNSHLGARASKETPGIVLIDEIDMHLHPRWQQSVLQNLLQAFPLVQFIVTTHSPQVLTTVRRENVRVLTQAGTQFSAHTPDFSPLAHDAGDALAKIMGTHPRPDTPLQSKVLQFEALVRDGQEQSATAMGLRAELNDAGYEVHPSDLTTWRFLASRKRTSAS